MSRRYLSLRHATAAELAALAGWHETEGGVVGPHGDRVLVREDADGYLTITVPDGVDARDLLEMVPFEEVKA